MSHGNTDVTGDAEPGVPGKRKSRISQEDRTLKGTAEDRRAGKAWSPVVQKKRRAGCSWEAGSSGKAGCSGKSERQVVPGRQVAKRERRVQRVHKDAGCPWNCRH